MPSVFNARTALSSIVWFGLRALSMHKRKPKVSFHLSVWWLKFMWRNLVLLQEEHAAKGGVDAYGHHFKGGEFLPFYVPRERMPQIDEQDLPNLIDWAKGQSMLVLRGTICPQELRAHQRIDIKRVHAMDTNVLAKPCLISGDDYVLDGNHRWWGHVLAKTLVPYTQFSLPFERAIPWLFTFPKTYSYGDGKFHPVQN